MTEKFMIDEEYIDITAKASLKLIEVITLITNEMKDTEKDVFLRFMAFCKLQNILHGSDFAMDMYRANIHSGHCLGHPFLQTSASKKNDWHKIKIYNHDFFCEDEESEQHNKTESSVDLKMTEFDRKLEELTVKIRSTLKEVASKIREVRKVND
jgi:hypothetical protein